MLEATPELYYRDPGAALGWLERVFGLATELVVADDQGRHVFARVTGGVAIVGELPARQSPSHAGGVSTQAVLVALDDGLEAHCERARAAGARIEMEPMRAFFGLAYTAMDLEGHLWSFTQALTERQPPPEGWSVRVPGEAE